MKTFNFERYGAGAGPEHAGKLVKYTSIGCYPVAYAEPDGSTLCAKCANEADAACDPIDSQWVNWEDADLYCDGCGGRIESAYAEDAYAERMAERRAKGEY